MTETEAGALNKPNLIDECQMAVFEVMDVADGLDATSALYYAEAVINVLRKRGLLNQQGLEIIERDAK